MGFAAEPQAVNAAPAVVRAKKVTVLARSPVITPHIRHPSGAMSRRVSPGPVLGSVTRAAAPLPCPAVKTKRLEREDLIRWMSDAPTYRVDFWRPISTADPAKGVATGYKQDSYYVTEADVDEVISWAESEADGRGIVIYLSTTRHNDEPGLVRLSGEDPTKRR